MFSGKHIRRSMSRTVINTLKFKMSLVFEKRKKQTNSNNDKG